MKKFTKISLVVFVILSVLVGCNQTKESTDDPNNPDVIVIGAGGAGLAGALEAVDAGANQVVIIERLAVTGGSLNTTSGTISGANTIIQQEDGLTEDSLESYKQDLMNEGMKDGGTPNEALIDQYVEEAGKTVDWLWENGLKDKEFSTDADGNKSVFAPEHTLYSYPRSYKPKPDDPSKYKSATHEILDQMVAANDKIEVRLSSQVIQLKANDKGQVLTVVVKDLNTGETYELTANKGIIVATGGYSANPELMGAFKEHGDVIIAGGLITSDGNGLKLMQEVGGAINEEAMGWIPTFPMGLESLQIPGTGRIATTKTQYTGGILVNMNGERFIDETESDNVIRELALEEQPNGVQYEIYTDKIAEDLIASGQGYMLQGIFMTEAGSQYVVSASSLEELAEKLDIPVETFVKTVEDYNTAVDAGGTDSFGRTYAEAVPPYNLAINKIEGETYYAVAIKPIALLTLGGIQVNDQLQVIDNAGNPIPGLYAAGEVIGGVWGKFVSSGTGVMGSLVFGRIAGRNVMSSELTSGYEVKEADNLLDASLFEKEENNSSNEAVDLTGAKDGTYTAEVDGQEGKMEVEVVIEAEKITAVTILSHNETESLAGPALEQIPEAIVAANSTAVDSVSGATLTSNRIIEAVESCIEQAKQ